MGDENTVLSLPERRHLLRRSGFGVVKRDVDRFEGLTRGQAADQLLSFKLSKFEPRGQYLYDAQAKWIKKMITTRAPLQEKMVLFWHDHFATNFATVQDIRMMSRQNRLLRMNCIGNFKDLVKAVNKDPAMMRFLDTGENYRFQPNENYARELMELFTLGVFDSSGNINYTQDDITQIARAFTGWTYEDDGVAYLELGDGDPEGGSNCTLGAVGLHDYTACYPGRGPKVIFKTTGQFGAAGSDFTVNGEGEAEIDTVIDIIFQHRDSDMENTVARYVGRRLFEFFAYPNPAISVVDAIVQTSSFDTTFEIKAFLRALFTHDEFYASAAAPASGVRRSVKWPADFFVGTLRSLGMRAKGRYQYVAGGDYINAHYHLDIMGQELLEPPSVFGWDLEAGWISSSSLLARFSFVRDATSARDGGGTSFRPAKLMDLSLSDPGAIVDAVLDALNVPDQFTAAERQALVDYLGPGPIDLEDYDTRSIKLHGLFGLVLQSPAYQTH
jgi:uncharacterized protein (DUF1800 family)